MIRRVISGALLGMASPVCAQVAVTSPGPEAVSVTLYRDPDRGDGAIDRNFPTGFALVTETRTIRLPAGRAVIRFEGVAGGILPESAVLSGLPAGVREKNLDADLLSPRSLYDRALGRRVLIRRTDRATGQVTSEQAIIRSSGEGAAVVQTSAGVEALRCTGLAETLTYPGIPAGLPPRPTLSIEVAAPAATDATITLAYLAGGFDWQANHVVTIGPDGRAQWSARVTLASSDVTGFIDAGLQLVAGKVNREEAGELIEPAPGYLPLRCWLNRGPPAPPAPPAPPPPKVYAASPVSAPMAMREGDIVVTGNRVRLERLGDLKLYRAPRSVTVAAKSQKQIGMFDRDDVRFDPFYRSDVSQEGASEPQLILSTRNRAEDGLGLPLPAGPVTVFANGAARPLLIGEAKLTDRAVDERVEVELPTGGDVRLTQRPVEADRQSRLITELTVTNATPRPIRYEARLEIPTDRELVRRRGVSWEDGRWIWRTSVPANGSARFNFATDPLDQGR